jgi:hypothetical protein
MLYKCVFDNKFTLIINLENQTIANVYYEPNSSMHDPVKVAAQLKGIKGHFEAESDSDSDDDAEEEQATLEPSNQRIDILMPIRKFDPNLFIVRIPEMKLKSYGVAMLTFMAGPLFYIKLINNGKHIDYTCTNPVQM